tara:strand:+ start:105 stop:362 length:258 start_codon:yes stop_codon:yes gene_type:complete
MTDPNFNFAKFIAFPYVFTASPVRASVSDVFKLLRHIDGFRLSHNAEYCASFYISNSSTSITMAHAEKLINNIADISEGAPLRNI